MNPTEVQVSHISREYFKLEWWEECCEWHVQKCLEKIDEDDD